MKKVFVFLLIFIVLFSVNSFAKEGNNLPNTKVSFDFDNLELSKAFQLISDVTEVNILFNAETDKKVSLNFDNVEFSKLINIMTESYGMDYFYKNNILIIDTKKVIKQTYKTDEDKIKIGSEDSSSSIVITSSNTDSNIIINSSDDEDKSKEDKLKEMKGISKGSLIPAKNKLGLISSEEGSPVIVEVTKNIEYKGDLVIPKGSVFTGKGRADYGVRKIFINLNTLIIGDKEIDIKAHFVKEDGTQGFRSEYIDLSKENFWSDFLLGFVGDITGALKDVTYIDSGQPVEKNTVKNKMVDNTQKGIDNYRKQVESDAEKHQAIIKVNPNVKGYVFIDEKIPLKYLTEKKESD